MALIGAHSGVTVSIGLHGETPLEIAVLGQFDKGNVCVLGASAVKSGVESTNDLNISYHHSGERVI